MKRYRFFLFYMLTILALTLPPAAGAQVDDPAPIPRVHVVQAGENLTFIAGQYGVSVDDLLQVNNLSDGNLLYEGQELLIPGGEGEAVAALHVAQAGDTLAGIAAGYNTTVTAVTAANRLIYAHYAPVVGQTLAVVSRTGSAQPRAITGLPHVAAAGETLLEIAARYNLTPAQVAGANGLSPYAYLYPGQRLRIPGDAPYRYLPGEWVDVRIRPLPITQGGTLSIYVENLQSGQPLGELAGQSLRFTPYQAGYVALVGLDAFTPPGQHILTLSGTGERPWTPLRQPVELLSSNYGTQYINVGPELNDLLDLRVRADEDAFLSGFYTAFTPQRRWDGLFQAPVSNTIVTAGYGDGRSYNSGPIAIFHTGVDFGGDIGTPILAPAGGVVVFNDMLRLRGLTVIVDHGWGVMTSYNHLSETFVAVGDEVTPGQVLGAGGSTGLSTGPHLHWELRVHDVPVDGLQWTRELFP